METRLFDYIERQKEKFPQEKAFGRKEGNGWKFWSTSDLIDQAHKLASGLITLGFKKGDKISMVAYKNRPEWYIVDLATQYLGIVNVPLYPTISANEYVYILNDSSVKACFVGAEDLWDKVNAAQNDLPLLRHIFTFDKVEGRPYFEDLMSEENLDAVHSSKKSIKPSDLATIIYTSGTTGNPKGVMLSHSNISHVVDTTLESFPLSPGGKVLSFLPFCHIFERACIYGYSDAGVSVYCTGTDNLGGEEGDLKNVGPDFFTTVPRLLEKVYEKIYNKGLGLTGLKKKLFFWALSLADEHEHGKTFSGMAGFKRKIADKLIFSKWREALGGNIKGIVTGAAPCPVKIIKVFSTAGISVLEGYGLTETSPTISVNRFDGFAKVGSVGPIIDGVELIIDDSDAAYGDGEGEIIVHGPNIMQGYYNKPEATAEVFTEIDGKRWFKTGDIGKLVDGPKGTQYLKITDRKKELLKTSGGKYVAPAPIESKLKEDFLIEQVMVVGDAKKFVSALIVPAEEALKDWCQHNDVPWTNLEEVCGNEKVTACYQGCIENVNPNFSHVEQIKKFKVLPTTWEAIRPNGEQTELTPTMKLKRRVIREKYANDIDRIYNG
ncbi:MAG: long-chain fatty acid--CoA ligase [Saprospiraceae bacterium]|nr:long-chain fatty acid--CoA ligase [Saprospiraceae bacterium]